MLIKKEDCCQGTVSLMASIHWESQSCKNKTTPGQKISRFPVCKVTALRQLLRGQPQLQKKLHWFWTGLKFS